MAPWLPIRLAWCLELPGFTTQESLLEPWFISIFHDQYDIRHV